MKDIAKVNKNIYLKQDFARIKLGFKNYSRKPRWKL